MLKKILSATLAVLLCAVLAVPALAADRITKVRMSNNQIEMEVGETRTLFVRFTPSRLTDTLTWTSNNEKVAVVDENGTILAVGKGKATVRATTSGGLSTSATVQVRGAGEAVSVKSLEISTSSMTVRVNQTRLLWAYLSPHSATDKDVIWSSSDSNIAEVDPEGTVTGVAPGTATITAESSNGYKATCTVTVPGTVLKSKSLEEETVPNTQTANNGELLTSAAVKTEVELVAKATKKGETGTVTFKNKSAVSPTILKAAAFTAESNSRDVRLRFTTTDGEGKTLGALTLDPQGAKELTGDLKLGVLTDSKKVSAVAAKFSKYYKNNLAALQLAQNGSYGLSVQVAAKVDMSKMDKSNLCLYRYDEAGDSYALVEGKVWVDSKEYLRFTTDTGGVYLVSDGPLTK